MQKITHRQPSVDVLFFSARSCFWASFALSAVRIAVFSFVSTGVVVYGADTDEKNVRHIISSCEHTCASFYFSINSASVLAVFLCSGHRIVETIVSERWPMPMCTYNHL